MDSVDYIIKNTSLQDCLIAACLASQNYKVFVVEEASNYGGRDQIIDLAALLPTLLTDHRIEIPSLGALEFLNVEKPEKLSEFNRLNISLYPRLLRCSGKWVDIIKTSGVGDYLEFKLMSNISYVDPTGECLRLPVSKEDIFNSDKLSLLEKRKLMKTLMNASSSDAVETQWNEFAKGQNLPEKLSNLLYYAGGCCFDGRTLDKATVVNRLERYKNSLGIYGGGGYLDAMYGLGSELVQAFARLAAVHGAVFDLNDGIASIDSLNRVATTRKGHSICFEKGVLDQLDDGQQTDETCYHRIIMLKSSLEKQDILSKFWVIPENGNVVVAVHQGHEIGATSDPRVSILHLLSAAPIEEDTWSKILALDDFASMGQEFSLALKHKCKLNVTGTSLLDSLVLDDSIIDSAEAFLREKTGLQELRIVPRST